MDEAYSDAVVAAATRSIVDALGEHGVIDVRWVRGWAERPIVWLITDMSAERNAIVEQGCFADTVRGLIGAAGVPDDSAARAAVACRSNEAIAKAKGGWDPLRDVRPDVEDVKQLVKPRILEALAPHGVTEAMWSLAYHGYPAVSLVTQTYAAKAHVAEHDCFRDVIRALLTEAGVPDDLVEQAAVGVESQETVDRDCGGSWGIASM